MTTCRGTYEKGDVVLVPFPFTDLSTRKKRPGVVISPAELNATGDITIAFLTSKTDLAPRPGDCKIKLWKEAGLPKPSMVRMKFVTLSSALVTKRIGHLGEEDKKKIFETIRKILG